MVDLPSFQDVSQKTMDYMTPTELFIFNYEVAGSDDEMWREQLSDLIEEQIEANRKAPTINADLKVVIDQDELNKMIDAEVASLKKQFEWRITRLQTVLIGAAEQFRFYETEHKKKGTPDGDAKAETNERFADMCFEAVKMNDSTS